MTTSSDSSSGPSAAPLTGPPATPLLAANSEVSPAAELGPGTRVWGLAQVREDAVIGGECIIGRGAYVGVGVTVGSRCKVQNDALLYEPAVIGDGVFIGPAAVLTNDAHPRATNPDGSMKSPADWHSVGVTIADGASIGARAVCVAPVRIGRWALVAAGSTVIRDVPDFALVAGTPARQVGWVGRAGQRLERGRRSHWTCPVTDEQYAETSAGLVEVR